MTTILPAIDIIAGRCVRLSQGDYSRRTTYSSSPVDMVKRFVDHGMQRIHVVDLDGAKASAPANLHVLEQMAAVNGALIEWGGGIKSEQSLSDLFNAGASYAIIGSLAAREPDTMASWLTAHGPDRIVLGADIKEGKVAVSGWLESTTLSIDQLIDRLLHAGLSQAICTEISRDGMLSGADVDLYKHLMLKYPSVIFTASGGIGSMAHIEELAAVGVPRVIVGKALYEGHVTLSEMSHFIENQSC